MLLYLRVEGFHFGDKLLYGEAERGGQDCLEFEEVGVRFVAQDGLRSFDPFGSALLRLSHKNSNRQSYIKGSGRK